MHNSHTHTFSFGLLKTKNKIKNSVGFSNLKKGTIYYWPVILEEKKHCLTLVWCLGPWERELLIFFYYLNIISIV